MLTPEQIEPHLTEREYKVMMLRYGINDGHSRTLSEIGAVFNVSRERIRQIESSALCKLQKNGVL